MRATKIEHFMPDRGVVTADRPFELGQLLRDGVRNLLRPGNDFLSAITILAFELGPELLPVDPLDFQKNGATGS
jgi:hypothetical protein